MIETTRPGSVALNADKAIVSVPKAAVKARNILYTIRKEYVHKHCIASPASYIDRGGEMGGGHISASSKAAELKRKTRQAHARLFIPQLFGSAIAPVLARKACVPSQIEGGKKRKTIEKRQEEERKQRRGKANKRKNTPAADLTRCWSGQLGLLWSMLRPRDMFL